MQLVKILAASSALAAGVALAAGKSLTIGQTFPIAEPDVLEEIKQKAAATDWRRWMRKAPADYGAFKSVELPHATKNESRLFDPSYAIPFDIPDDKGKLLYPKGYRINIYDRIRVPGRYIVIGPSAAHLRWLDEVAKPSERDKVLIAGGNALLVRQSTGRTVYVLEERFVERFGLKAVPAIVKQEGNQLRIEEYAVVD